MDQKNIKNWPSYRLLKNPHISSKATSNSEKFALLSWGVPIRALNAWKFRIVFYIRNFCFVFFLNLLPSFTKTEPGAVFKSITYEIV